MALGPIKTEASDIFLNMKKYLRIIEIRVEDFIETIRF